MIEYEVVERTFREVSAYSPVELETKIRPITQRQPDLLAFVVTRGQQFSPSASEAAVYLALLIYQMFENGTPKPIARIGMNAFLSQAEGPGSRLNDPDGAGADDYRSAMAMKSPRQPHILRFLVEALLEEEPEGGEDQLELSEEDKSAVFRLLKTVIGTFDAHVRT